MFPWWWWRTSWSLSFITMSLIFSYFRTISPVLWIILKCRIFLLLFPWTTRSRFLPWRLSYWWSWSWPLVGFIWSLLRTIFIIMSANISLRWARMSPIFSNFLMSIIIVIWFLSYMSILFRTPVFVALLFDRSITVFTWVRVLVLSLVWSWSWPT